MRKKDETLENTILELARDMANTTGPDSINIRTIAEKAGIATGTVYNYFSSKDEILLALTEEYWRRTLSEMQGYIKTDIFYRQLEEIYVYLSQQIHQSAGLLMGSLHHVKADGREKMKSMQQTLSSTMLLRMEQDTSIRKDIWNQTFSKENYANFIVMNMMLLLQRHASDIDFFIEIVKRTLY